MFYSVIFVLLLLLLQLCLQLSIAAPPKGEKFRWVSKPWPYPKGAPPIPGLPRFKTVEMKDKVEIQCKTNDPSAIVTLNKGRRRNRYLYPVTIDDKIKQQKQVFTIVAVRTYDAGYYSCSAISNTNKIDLKLGTLNVLQLRKAQKPEVIPSGVLVIERFGSTSIRCHAASHSKRSFLTWYRKFANGTRLKIDKSRIKSNSITRRDKTIVIQENLIFANITPADVGEYVCERVVSGISTSENIQIKLAPDKPPEVPEVEVGVTINPKEKDKLRLICKGSGSPKPTVVWQKDDVELRVCDHHYTSKGPTSCMYSTNNVRLEETNGLYQCVARNMFGEATDSINIVHPASE